MQVSKFSLRNGFRPYLLSFRGICREAAQTQLAKVLRQSNDMAPTARKEKQYCSGDQRRGAEGGSQIQSLNRGEEQRSRGREARSRGDEQREGGREQRRRAGRERQGRGGLTFGLAGADWPAAGGSGRREQTPAGRKAPSGEELQPAGRSCGRQLRLRGRDQGGGEELRLRGAATTSRTRASFCSLSLQSFPRAASFSRARRQLRARFRGKEAKSPAQPASALSTPLGRRRSAAEAPPASA